MPDRYWYSDITEFHLNGQKLYLSPIMDGCTQEIISYTLSRHPVLNQVMDMLDLAYKKHPALSSTQIKDGNISTLNFKIGLRIMALVNLCRGKAIH